MKTHEEWTMVERKPETLDFVKDFQEYLTQQTQHVNMISGSISADRESETLSAGPEIDRNRLDLPSVGASLEENSGMLVDGFERTCDGKLKCSYCNYASKGTARLIEHIRIHTGEKPHRCHLCPFASAYERHLEAHMRSHTGEKPYKCDLCSFRCSDRSNLSHHRRRRHKLLPLRGAHSALSGKRTFGILHRKSSSLGYNRRLLVNFSTPLLALHKPDHLRDFGGGSSREAYGPAGESPLDQLSTLAGHLAGLPLARDPPSPGGGSYRHEKLLRVGPPVSPPASPVVGPGSEHSPRISTSTSTSTPSVSNSQPSTPAPAPAPAPTLPAQDHQLLHSCPHCDTYFADNILFTIHMGCHGYENPFQCNICGCQCKDQYDFACHFARGQHK